MPQCAMTQRGSNSSALRKHLMPPFLLKPKHQFKPRSNQRCASGEVVQIFSECVPRLNRSMAPPKASRGQRRHLFQFGKRMRSLSLNEIGPDHFVIGAPQWNHTAQTESLTRAIRKRGDAGANRIEQSAVKPALRNDERKSGGWLGRPDRSQAICFRIECTAHVPC